MRRLLAIGISLPAVVAGTWWAHVLAYRWATPDDASRARHLEETGHGYAHLVPQAIAVLAAVALVCAVAAVLRGSAGAALALRPGRFVALPAVAYALQEHVERLPGGHGHLLDVATEPTFWRGLVLQLPFGLLAWLAARVVLHGVAAVERAVHRCADLPAAAVGAPPPGAARGRAGDRCCALRPGRSAVSFRGPPARLAA